MSGTVNTIDTYKVTDTTDRCVMIWTRYIHPKVGQNLMVGDDLLDGCTYTSEVSQRSESGQGILGDKAGRGLLLWYDVVVVVLSSHMSTGGWSLAGRRDNLP